MRYLLAITLILLSAISSAAGTTAIRLLNQTYDTNPFVAEIAHTGSYYTSQHMHRYREVPPDLVDYSDAGDSVLLRSSGSVPFYAMVWNNIDSPARFRPKEGDTLVHLASIDLPNSMGVGLFAQIGPLMTYVDDQEFVDNTNTTTGDANNPTVRGVGVKIMLIRSGLNTYKIAIRSDSNSFHSGNLNQADSAGQIDTGPEFVRTEIVFKNIRNPDSEVADIDVTVYAYSNTTGNLVTTTTTITDFYIGHNPFSYHSEFFNTAELYFIDDVSVELLSATPDAPPAPPAPTFGEPTAPPWRVFAN